MWVLFYWFYFWWLSKTDAGNGSIIAVMEVFFAYLILDVIIKHQKSPISHIIWAILMSIWAFCALFKWSFKVNLWDILILIWTMFSPFWYYYAQQARKEISSASLMFLRSIICSIIFLAVSYIFNIISLFWEIIIVLPWLLINWFLLLWLSKIFFYEGTHRVSIQKAVTIWTLWPIFTLIFAYSILWEIPNWWQIFGLIPIMIWSYFITKPEN